MGVLFALGGGVCGNLDNAGAGGAAGIVADRSSRFSACDNHIVDLFGFIESRNGVFGNKGFLLRSECFIAAASVFNRFAAVLGHRLKPCNLVLDLFGCLLVCVLFNELLVLVLCCNKLIFRLGVKQLLLRRSKCIKCFSCSLNGFAAFEGNGSELRNRFVNGFCRCFVGFMLVKESLILCFRIGKNLEVLYKLFLCVGELVICGSCGVNLSLALVGKFNLADCRDKIVNGFRCRFILCRFFKSFILCFRIGKNLEVLYKLLLCISAAIVSASFGFVLPIRCPSTR